jgi:chaperone BCS1
VSRYHLHIFWSDLRDLFAGDNGDYYHQNGRPCRKGYLFYGSPETDKTSLSIAIASHYYSPLYVIDMAKMNDTVLQEMVQSLPKRCVVLFVNNDAIAIVRERNVVAINKK